MLHAGKRIADSPHYDIDNGRVIITFRDFSDWTWTRMEQSAHALLVEISRTKHPLPKIDSDTLNKSAVTVMLCKLLSMAEEEMEKEQEEEANERRRRRANLVSSHPSSKGTAVSLAQQHPFFLDIGTNASLIELAQKTFPPCMARHVWRALVYKKHPKHE